MGRRHNYSTRMDRTKQWAELLREPGLKSIMLKVEILGGIHAVKASNEVIKELLSMMYDPKDWRGMPDRETKRMRSNFKSIISQTVWFNDFLTCALKRMCIFLKIAEGKRDDVPDFQHLEARPEDVDDISGLKALLFKKLVEKLSSDDEEQEKLRIEYEFDE